jgi:stage V sporulation protein S
MDIIKVSGSSRTSAVAGAIAGVFREHRRAEVQAIGAGAVNQAVKALVLATGYLAADGLSVIFTPEFVDVEIDDKIRTAIRLVVELKPGTTAPDEVPQHIPAVVERAEHAPFSSTPVEETEPSAHAADPQEELFRGAQEDH